MCVLLPPSQWLPSIDDPYRLQVKNNRNKYFRTALSELHAKSNTGWDNKAIVSAPTIFTFHTIYHGKRFVQISMFLLLFPESNSSHLKRLNSLRNIFDTYNLDRSAFWLPVNFIYGPILPVAVPSWGSLYWRIGGQRRVEWVATILISTTGSASLL
jgi:hypothetical protein